MIKYVNAKEAVKLNRRATVVIGLYESYPKYSKVFKVEDLLNDRFSLGIELIHVMVGDYFYYNGNKYQKMKNSIGVNMETYDTITLSSDSYVIKCEKDEELMLENPESQD